MNNFEAALRAEVSKVKRKYHFQTIGRLSISGFKVEIAPPSDIAWHSPESIIFEVTSVGVLVIININAVPYFLLVQQGDRAGNPWEYPSGGVDRDQDQVPEDTAIRELVEETGVRVNKEDLNALAYHRKPKDKTKGALQYFIELDSIPNNWNILSTDEEGRIYFKTPEGVDENEISMMTLEPLKLINTRKSLGTSTHHPWANSVWKALVEKAIYQIEI